MDLPIAQKQSRAAGGQGHRGDHLFPWLSEPKGGGETSPQCACVDIEDRPKKVRKTSQREQLCSPFLWESAQTLTSTGEFHRFVERPW